MKLTVGGITCGVGNLLGFHNAGFKPLFLVDDREFIHKGAKTLFNMWEDICLSDKLDDFRCEKPTLIISSPNCAQISTLGNKRADRSQLNEMSLFEFDFSKTMVELFQRNSDFMVVEYLPKLLDYIEIKHDMLYREITGERLEFPQDYRVQIVKLNSSSYGVPQNRKRLFIFFSKKKYDFIYIPPMDLAVETKTVGDVILELDDYRAEYDLPNDDAPHHSVERTLGFDKLKYGESFYGTQNNRRLDPSKICPTITSHCTQYVHPYAPRVLTVREAAAFQGYPIEFEFFGSTTTQLDLVGKSISPPICEHIGAEVKRCINEWETK